MDLLCVTVRYSDRPDVGKSKIETTKCSINIIPSYEIRLFGVAELKIYGR
jgi:hypothetical protein